MKLRTLPPHVLTAFDHRYQQEKQEYEKRVQQRIGSDRFASRYAQTVNWALKTKEVRRKRWVVNIPCTSILISTVIIHDALRRTPSKNEQTFFGDRLLGIR